MMVNGPRAALFPERRWDAADLRIALGIAFVSLPFLGWAMMLWSTHGVFNQYNILFDSDPSDRLSVLANGWSRTGTFHPILDWLFSVPIRAVVAVAGTLHPFTSPVAVRQSIALWIAPVLSALKTGTGYLLGRTAGASRAGSFGLSLLVGFSLCPVIFGTIPDHMALSGLALTITFVWATAVQFGMVRDRYRVWLILMFFVAGITVTNLIVVLSLFLACRLGRIQPWRKVLASAALLVLISVGAALASSWVFGRMMHRKDDIPDYVQKFLRTPGIDRAIRFVPALAHSVVAPYPATMANKNAEGYNSTSTASERQIDLQFSYDIQPLTPWNWSATLLTLGIIGLGAKFGWDAEPRIRPLVIASLLIVLFNGSLHWIWGDEWLLYSTHWHSALMLLLAGWLVRNSSRGAVVVTLLGIAAAGTSAVVLREMLLQLERAPR